MPGGPKPRVVLVVARADNGVIGRGGGLPWRLSSDLRRFRALTMGKPVIMGRKTFQSIGRPLAGRDNIVVTRDPAFAADGVVAVGSVEDGLALATELANRRGAGEIAVIGGTEIFAGALPSADVIELTEVHASPDGDTLFPALGGHEWKEVSRVRHDPGPRDSAPYSFVRLERRDP